MDCPHLALWPQHGWWPPRLKSSLVPGPAQKLEVGVPVAWVPPSHSRARRVWQSNKAAFVSLHGSRQVWPSLSCRWFQCPVILSRQCRAGLARRPQGSQCGCLVSPAPRQGSPGEDTCAMEYRVVGALAARTTRAGSGWVGDVHRGGGWELSAWEGSRVSQHVPGGYPGVSP